jgi:uncharacterized protein (TIGR03437 family)
MIKICSLLCLCAVSVTAATLGQVIPLVGGASDLVLDEANSRLFLTASTQNLVQVYSLQKKSFLSAIPTDQTPLSATLSRDGKSLFVVCYNSSVLDVIDLTTLAITNRLPLPAKPVGVAAGSDGRVLISTTGSGTNGASNVLLLYNPAPNAAVILSSLSATPPVGAAPTFPPPSSRPFLSKHSQLAASRNGSYIAGVNVPAAGSATVFVYETASGTVLRARAIPGSSTALAISDDGTRILSGVNLFDASSLRLLAQQNSANSPYPITPGTIFTTAAVQGGAAFTPDGQTLYTGFNISPVQVPAAPSNVSELMLTDPDNLLIRMGIQLPDNLAGRMVIGSDGSNVYALSDSGFVILPAGTISQSALAMPSTDAVLLTRDPCAVTSQTSSAAVNINNPGKGRVTATAQLLQYPGQANQANPATAPSARSSQDAAGPQLVFGFNPSVPQGTATVTPPHDFLIQSPEAINIPDRIRVYENSRDSDARGTIVPVPVGIAAGATLPDLAYDATRQRVYIANSGLNRIEVYDIKQQAFLTPVKVGQLPVSMALTPDANTLYVANSGGETITIVDPDKMQAVGTVNFPPLAFNSTLAAITPSVIAAGLSGPQILMSDGSLWTVSGSTLVLRGVSTLLGQTAAGLPVKLPVPSTMAATAGGEYILLATGTGLAYLYDATLDDWVAERQISTAAATGYIGPVVAGAKGQFFVVNGMLLNQALVPVRAAAGLISAMATVGSNSYAIYSPPATGGTTAPAIQILDGTTGNSPLQVNALEGPATQIAATGRALIGGRTMAVDSTGTTAYIITASGLSIIPLAAVATADRPIVNPRGAVSLATNQLPVAPNVLMSIFGQNLASNDAPATTPWPVILGGACVTLNNVALPLFMASPTQINAQIPPNFATGTFPLIVHSLARQAASVSQQLAVSKYAPGVLIDANGQLALFHADGKYVNKNNPATRDEPLTMYALGLGPTTGGPVTAGTPSPSNPLAASGKVAVFFGNPGYKQAAIIVDWSGLTPGLIGVYQLNLRIPGFHMNGDALPVSLQIGGVSSPTKGAAVPYVSVD